MRKKSLVDKFGRQINYLRIAVTDRCNFRCTYCMPEQGIDFLPRQELLSYEEMIHLVQILSRMGISKVRLTGGEPFIRKNFMYFLNELTNIEGIDQVNITTNGAISAKFIPELKQMGIGGINLSLDTIDKEKFFQITRRDELDKVIDCLDQLIEYDIPTKINCVVMENMNIDDIIPLVKLGENRPISIRFIEEMPFSGNGLKNHKITWDYQKIVQHIMEEYPSAKRLTDSKNTTSYNYQIPNFKGTFGVIPAFSRTICGACNRIRITPTGVIKTCLYDKGVFNIKDLARAGATDLQLETAIRDAVSHKYENGFIAEEEKLKIDGNDFESMAKIGG